MKEPLVLPEATGRTALIVRISRIDTDLRGAPGRYWQAEWEFDDGSSSVAQGEDLAYIVRCVAQIPALEMLFQHPETGKWSPCSPPEVSGQL
jgi:hypothetical protein